MTSLKLISLVVLLISLPLYIVRFGILELPTTILEISFFSLFVIWSIDFLMTKKKISLVLANLRNPILVPGLLFLLVGLLSVFTSPDVYKGFGAFRAYIVEPIVLYIILLNFDNSDRNRFAEKIIIFLVLASVPIALLGIYQFITGTNFIAPLEAIQERVTSLFNHPNFLALYLGPIILLTYSKITQPKNTNNKIIYWAIFILFLFIFFTTKSRGGLLGLATAFVSIFLLKYYDKIEVRIQRYFRYIFYGIFGLGLLVATYFFLNISDYTPNNKLVWPRLNPQTSIIRLCVWEGTRNILKDSPIFGAGLAGFAQVYPDYRTCDTELFVYPHNIILNFWSEMGIFGVSAFLFLMYTVVKYLMKDKKNSYRYVLISVLIYWLVHGFFDVPYFKNDLSMLFWIVLALVILTGPKNSRLTE